jgi:hypothetical protein
LKRLVADLSLDKVMRQDVPQKVLKPVKQREVVHYLMGRYEVSERRALHAARLCAFTATTAPSS